MNKLSKAQNKTTTKQADPSTCFLSAVAAGKKSPVAWAAEQLGISKQALQKHVHKLVQAGTVTTSGTGKGTKYKLASKTRHGEYKLQRISDEAVIWEEHALPILPSLPSNVRDICSYGFTEMVNNAIDHSNGRNLQISIEQNPVFVKMQISDDGIGIFDKLASQLNLMSARDAILQLSKGKMTTDPQNHTGEGIFFTSRAFDCFSIFSHNLGFTHAETVDEWVVQECDDEHRVKGTVVNMVLQLPTTRTLESVFAKYSSGPDEYRFVTTHVPLKLAVQGDEGLFSRSQARRVMSRVNKFKNVILDFKGVRIIGQGFADEIFRVYQSAHPSIKISWLNANQSVELMIRRALSESKQGRAIQ